jgi:CubicO group peptidase (beta-lactamase class C family)
VTDIVAAGYEPVAEQFAGLLAADPDYAAQFCGYVDGVAVVDLTGGPGVEPDSLLGVWSATKGVAAVCVAVLVQRGQLDLDLPVVSYWPEFGQHGKHDLTLRTVLSHQAGLVGVEPQLSLDEMLDHDVAAARVAGVDPHWRPGAAHGYHAVTMGTLIDQLVRRVTGLPVAAFFRNAIAGVRDIDFHIATPRSEEKRVVEMLPPRYPEGRPPAPVEPDSLAGMALNLAGGAIRELGILPNNPRARAAGLAAGGGLGTARGLARLYASCIAPVDGVRRLLTPETVAAMARLQVAGHDLVLDKHSRFAVVFQKAGPHLPAGSHLSFGHEGAGGAIGWADPWHGVAYGHIPRRMVVPAGADPNGLALARTLRACAAAVRAAAPAEAPEAAQG